MADLIRDSVVGQCLRLLCNPSWLRYDEQQGDYDHQCEKLQHQHGNTILVDWYSDDDKENPQNWSRAKKAFVAFVIGAYSFVVYMAAPHRYIRRARMRFERSLGLMKRRVR
jgi:MFS transporter, DHA1 family, multidrug resistance protein